MKKTVKSLLESALHDVPAPLVCVDEHGTLEFMNAAANGLSKIAETSGSPSLTERFPVLAGHIDDIRRALKTGTAWNASRIEGTIGGTPVVWTVTLIPIRMGDDDRFLIQIDDETERVNAERLVVKNDKLMALGGLAAGMAHEINNPLAGILQSLQVVRDRLTQDSPINRKAADALSLDLPVMREYLRNRKILYFLNEMESSCRRAVSIIENMLNFSRETGPARKLHHVHLLIDQAIDLAVNDFSMHRRYDFRLVEFRKNYDTGLPRVMCEGRQIQHVFFNILRFAAHSMITEDRRHLHHQISITTSLHAGRHRTVITDNGPGIPEDVRSRLFEPVPLPRKIPDGSESGLAVPHFIIVHNHHGRMTVESSPGKGTTYIIDLPVAPGGKSPGSKHRTH